MADHRGCFALGTHIQFGSLDFLCTGEDHDLVLFPPSVSDDLASPSGFNEHVGDLDPTGVEECVLPFLAKSPNSPSKVDSVTESMVGLCLYANEAQASRGT
jgi:hypothetical protein